MLFSRCPSLLPWLRRNREVLVTLEEGDNGPYLAIRFVSSKLLQTFLREARVSQGVQIAQYLKDKEPTAKDLHLRSRRMVVWCSEEMERLGVKLVFENDAVREAWIDVRGPKEL